MLASTALAPDGAGEMRLREAGENVEVELEVRGLPESREDEYYELWFVDDDGRMSGGTFRVGPEGWASVNLTAPPSPRSTRRWEQLANPTTGIPGPVERKVWEENYKLPEPPAPKYAPTLIKLHYLDTLTPL